MFDTHSRHEWASLTLPAFSIYLFIFVVVTQKWYSICGSQIELMFKTVLCPLKKWCWKTIFHMHKHSARWPGNGAAHFTTVLHDVRWRGCLSFTLQLIRYSFILLCSNSNENNCIRMYIPSSVLKFVKSSKVGYRSLVWFSSDVVFCNKSIE